MKILVIEDAEILRNSLIVGLENTGYRVDGASDGEDGLWRAIEYDYDLILLDIMLPKLNGFDLLIQLRRIKKDTLVLILTARDEIKNRVRGLNEDADDYLIKPFEFAELLARIARLFRRRFRLAKSCITIRHITIDIERKVVSANGNQLNLPPREYALLEYFILNRQRVISRLELETRIYNDQVFPASNVVNSAISTLRKSIDQPGSASMIETKRGLGYKMVEK